MVNGGTVSSKENENKKAAQKKQVSKILKYIKINIGKKNLTWCFLTE